MSNTFLKFIRLTKVDGVKREVYGVVTSETPDKDGEICDYETTVPHYQAWSAEFEKSTDGKSLGNIREMHDNRAAGKVTALEFDAAAREIRINHKDAKELKSSAADSSSQAESASPTTTKKRRTKRKKRTRRNLADAQPREQQQ